MPMSLRSVVLGAVLFALPCLPAFARFEPVTCHNSFTAQQEVDEGGKVALKVYQQMPVLPENDPVTRYVQQLGARLVSFAPHTPGLEQQWPFSFHVVASSDVNAFALPGGSIFVNLGTIQAAETESQLAGVMAHEMSHVIMRHSTCNLAKQQNRSILYSLGAIGSSIFLGNGAAGSLAQAGLGIGEKLDFLHMSRDDERQADLLGVNILSAAGYDPRGLPQFFEIIKAKSGAGGAQFLSDHPNPGNRTEYVNAEIATLPPRNGNTVINTAEFRRMHSIADSERALTSQQVTDGHWKQSGLYASGPGSNGNGQNYPQQGSPTQNSPQQQAVLAPISLSRLGLRDRLTLYQAPRWSISAPSSWNRQQNQSANADASDTQTSGTPPTHSVVIAPAGASGDFGIAYGVLISIAQVGGNGVHDQNSLSEATSKLIQGLLSSQPSLSQTGNPSSFQINGQPAYAVDLRGISPIGRNGKSDAEHDWMVTVARPDGDVSYLIFVAPQTQFDRLKPTFDRMLQTFKPE